MQNPCCNNCWNSLSVASPNYGTCNKCDITRPLSSYEKICHNYNLGTLTLGAKCTLTEREQEIYDMTHQVSEKEIKKMCHDPMEILTMCGSMVMLPKLNNIMMSNGKLYDLDPTVFQFPTCVSKSCKKCANSYFVDTAGKCHKCAK